METPAVRWRLNGRNFLNKWSLEAVNSHWLILLICYLIGYCHLFIQNDSKLFQNHAGQINYAMTEKWFWVEKICNVDISLKCEQERALKQLYDRKDIPAILPPGFSKDRIYQVWARPTRWRDIACHCSVEELIEPLKTLEPSIS